jgi:alkylresorcinol/alkylpyrone synthase
MHITAVSTAFPSHRYRQTEIAEALSARWGHKMEEPRLLGRLHANCGVEWRNLVLPLGEYPKIETFTQANDQWIASALTLGERAVNSVLEKAGLKAEQISAIFFATVTGIASPTIDARLINRLPFSENVKRIPIFGLGCVAGAAAISLASDYVKAYPDQHALILSIELCSLTWQDDDVSIANLISTGLFADGAAAVIVSGAEQAAGQVSAGPRVVATRSVFYRNTERVMGWDVTSTGFRIVLSPEVPALVLQRIRGDVDDFLASLGLSLANISSVICHSGGPKVLQAVETALELPAHALEPSWRSLREVGNLSAASVLHVLEDYLDNHRGTTGSYSLLMAMGPAFCSELVVLQW